MQVGTGTKRATATAPMTLPALYDAASERFGQSVAMKSRYPWGYSSITFQEFGRLISLVGSGLISRGLEKGDRVALIAENSPEWAIVYAAVTSCGAILVPLDTQLMDNEIRHLLLHADAKFLITSPRLYGEKLQGMNLRNVYLIVIGEQETGKQAVTLGEIMALGRNRIDGGDGEYFRLKAEVSPEDDAVICYTSGTTGGPKGAVLSHRNIASNVVAALERIQLGDRDRMLCILPLHHTYATLASFLAPLAAGCTIVFGRSLRPNELREDIEREGVTVISGVPLLFEHMLASLRRELSPRDAGRKPSVLSRIFMGIVGFVFRRRKQRIIRGKIRERGLGSLRFCISGGAALRPDVEKAFSKIGIPILQGYGMTETSPIIAVNSLDRRREGTVGQPLEGVEVDVLDPNDEGIGEIVVRGPNVMKGYFKEPQMSAEVIRDGWLRTGDLGYIDDDGYIALVGRMKSVIVTPGGKNVYPDEIEKLLGNSPYILESIVMAVGEGTGRQRLGAVVVPDYDALGASEELAGGLTEESIRETIRAEVKRMTAGLPDYKHITDILVRDQELPKTTTRKLKRHLVKWIPE